MAILRLEEESNPASLRIIALNPAVQAASDVPLAAVGKRIDKDFPLIAKSPFPEQVVAVMRSGKAANLGEGPGQYDKTRTFTATAFPIPPDCVGLLFEDVTERRRQQRLAHESEMRYRKIFEASTAAICLFEAKSRKLIDANPRFVEMLGLNDPAELIAKSIEKYGFWANDGEYRQLLEQLRAQHSVREAAVAFQTNSGQQRLALVALELFEVQDGSEYILGIFWRV